MKNLNNIFLDMLPSLDLHGEIGDIAYVKTNDFILESSKLNKKKVVIIHGKGTGVVKQRVYDALKINKHVLNYKTDNFNQGCTIVELK